MILARNYCDWFKTYVLIVSRYNMPVLYIGKPIAGAVYRETNKHARTIRWREGVKKDFAQKKIPLEMI